MSAVQWDGTPFPWERNENDEPTIWGAKIVIEGQDPEVLEIAEMPRVGDKVSVPHKGQPNDVHVITHVRAWGSGEGAFVWWGDDADGAKPAKQQTSAPAKRQTSAPASNAAMKLAEENADRISNAGKAFLAIKARVDKLEALLTDPVALRRQAKKIEDAGAAEAAAENDDVPF